MRQGMGSGIFAAGALLLAVTCDAQQLAPQMGRYMPLYPGLYFEGGYAQDERDSSYDQGGAKQDSAAPTAGGQTSFPEKSVIGELTWHFPMFESYRVPFFSSRTHLARMTFRYVDTRTEGQLATFAADPSDDATTNADDLKNNGKGLGDTTFEFGSYLWGSPADGWQTGKSSPIAALLLVGVNAPTGVYEHESPNNAGTNHWAFHGRLAGHWRPWRGGFVDAGYAYRVHSINYEPEFGGLAPFREGDERLWDASVGQRVWEGLYLTLFASDRRGDRNQYRDPEFAPNAPTAPPPTGGNYSSRDFPTPGTYYDQGTALRAYGLSLQYFVGQRWLAALHYTHPQAGKSGQFLLPFTNRQCTVAGGTSSASCSDQPDGAVVVDGMGPARSFASDRLMLTVTHNFGLGDAFTCNGCKQ